MLLIVGAAVAQADLRISFAREGVAEQEPNSAWPARTNPILLRGQPAYLWAQLEGSAALQHWNGISLEASITESGTIPAWDIYDYVRPATDYRRWQGHTNGQNTSGNHVTGISMIGVTEGSALQ